MNVLVFGQGVRLTDAVAAHVHRRLSASLDRFEDHINHVAVWLKDVNGPKAGRDKECDVLVGMAPLGVVVVKARKDDLYATVTEAAHRLRNAVGRRLTHAQERRRRPAHERAELVSAPPSDTAAHRTGFADIPAWALERSQSSEGNTRPYAPQAN